MLLPPDANGKRRQVSKGGFATEREARKALNGALDRLHRGTFVEVGRQTVGEYLDQWLEGKARLRATTRRSYGEHVELYLRPGLGHLRLSDLREVDIERRTPPCSRSGGPNPHRLQCSTGFSRRATPGFRAGR